MSSRIGGQNLNGYPDSSSLYVGGIGFNTGSGDVVTDYIHAYYFGQSGNAYTDDETGSSDLTNSNTTQYDDPVQGLVAQMDASPIDQSLSGMGKGTGAQSIAFIFSFDVTANVVIAKTSAINMYIHTFNATTIKIASTNNLSFTVPSMSVDTYYHLTATQDASKNTNVYLNGVVSSSGEQTHNAEFSFDLIGDYDDGGQTFDWLGEIGRLRIYDRELSAAEALEISNNDLK